MTLLGSDAWHDETHGRGPDDFVGQVKRAQLPWKQIDGLPTSKESIPLVQTSTQGCLDDVLKKI